MKVVVNVVARDGFLLLYKTPVRNGFLHSSRLCATVGALRDGSTILWADYNILGERATHIPVWGTLMAAR